MLPFSWSATLVLSAALIAFLSPFVRRALCGRHRSARRTQGPLGATALAAALLLTSWILAWTRFPWMGELQFHTFTPLWLSYVLLANVLLHRRTGSAPLFDEALKYSLLFPASALFWWCFEYLNRFTGNWEYQNISHFSALTYVIFATLAYSTVLPAIEVTKQLLADSNWLIPFRDWTKLLLSDSCLYACGGIALVALIFLPVFPQELFALMWLAPLFLLAALVRKLGLRSFLDDIGRGQWEEIVAYSAAGLVCGILWELWNYLSLARWTYAVPYVGAFKIFEMPLLGYAGYLPFGILCGMLIRLLTEDTSQLTKNTPTTPQDYFPILL